MANQQDNPVAGCLVIAALLAMVGSCVFSKDDEPEKTSAVASYDPPAPIINSEDLTGVEVDVATHTGPVGSNMLEQAVLDGFIAPLKGSTGANARDFVGATINSAGYLCSRAVEAQRAADQMYGVGCIMHSDGSGHANYMLNTATGGVTEI